MIFGQLVILVGAAYLATGFVYVRLRSSETPYLREPPSILKWPVETISNSEFSYWLMFALLVVGIIFIYL
jgi:hypothetical protein